MEDIILHSGKFNNYDGQEMKVTFYTTTDDYDMVDNENDLKFSGTTPVIINYLGDCDDIYAPLKTSSCDINIVSSQILDDLYTPKKNEIKVKVEKRVNVTDRVLVFDSNGTVNSASIYNDLNNHTIETRTLFYTDINGDFRFIGRVADRHNNLQVANLIYRTSTHTWDWDDVWYLNLNEWYFHDGTNSYKVWWESGDNRHEIEKWNGDDWDGNTHYYVKSENGVESDCAYGVENIIHFNDGIELWWGKKRYTWDAVNYKWIQTTSYTDERIANYYSIYGSSYHKILDKQGNYIDTVIVNGASGYDYSNYIAKLDRTNLTYKCIIPLSNESWNPDNVFEKNGYLYYVASEGAVYYWAWNIEEWVKWIEFTGDFTPNSFNLDYVVDTNKDVMIIYEKYLKPEFFLLTNITPPTVHYEYVPVPASYETIWKGYKLPNTYSQDVTQNLDNISMTAIDPVSIMKYAKINQILTKPAVVSYGELIGKSLAYVQIDESLLKVERVVTYGSNTYTGTNGLLDLKCQVSDFWDEAGEPQTIYTMLEEMLKPFCLVLAFDGNNFEIYSQNKTTGSRTFDIYTIHSNGTLSYQSMTSEGKTIYPFEDEAWKSNNIQNAAIEINSTYDKLTAVASTCIPSYNQMAMDLIDYNDRDSYDANMLNVQRNKSKGYKTTGSNTALDTNDYWYFLWNGVYVNDDYGLESHGGYVNGWLNINKAYNYLTGNTGHPSDYGSILNFYGGADNPTGTGKEQTIEKSVKINKRITAYAPDNGTPLEFLENSDLNWGLNTHYYMDDGGPHYDPKLSYSGNKSDSKWGTQKQEQGVRTVYHQEYHNMTLSETNQQVIELSLTQSYSRTGIDSLIDVLSNNTCTNKFFILENSYDEGIYDPYLLTASVNLFPYLWNAKNVKVDWLYFNRYKTDHDFKLYPVWDRRQVKMYIRLSDNNIMQFNGKEWVNDTQVRDVNAFYLLKLMNFKDLYHTDYKYDIIETADYDDEYPQGGGHYSLTGENFEYYVDQYGGVWEEPKTGLHPTTTKYCTPYNSPENEWVRWINKCGEGELSINLPPINDTSVTITVDISSSNMLGMTGGAATTQDEPRYANTGYFEVSGTGQITPQEGDPYTVTLSPSNVGSAYGAIRPIPDNGATIDFIPANVSYVKGEHLDLNISVTVPQSNLGQMFNQSDIKYTIDLNQGFAEEFHGPTFQVNTENNLVASSFSYIIYGNTYADPNLFYINGINARPECYAVQAYTNWLSVIRKIYTKTLVLLTDTPFIPLRTFITSPEVGQNELLVISDSWDIKSDRHSIKAVESQDLDVNTINAYAVIEVPRKARAERYNLPTSVKS